ncbi:MAG TPA: class A beta-lactamase [Acidobacteriaceae bacterium]|nr:class A beta-lactamase [Acidobacteriaceae bacterium]
MHARRIALLLSILLLVFCSLSHAQLREQIARTAAQAQGRVGVACSLPGKALGCDYHADAAFPMQSVYKLPISMAMLHTVEQGRFTLTQTIRFLPSDLIAPDQRSPLRDAHPHGNVDVPVEELLRGAIVDSDGVASDILMRSVGGASAVEAYVRSLGISGIEIRDTEKTLGREVALENRNSAQPRAVVALLRMLADRSPLSPEHTRLLLGWMSSTHTGDRRLKALLPPGTQVADKTGASGTGRKFTNATNDVGLITLPDGRKLAVAVFVADSAAPAAVREYVIAEIGHAIYAAASR